MKFNKPYLDKFYTGKFDSIEKKIHERDCINVLNLPFLRKINDFLNLLKTEEIKIKRLAKKHYNYNSLENDNKLIKLAKNIIEQLKDANLFKNNKLQITLKKNHESSKAICDYLKDLFTFESTLIDTNIKDYKDYLRNIETKINLWLVKIIKSYSSIKNNDVLFNENGKLSTNNIIEVIQFNINKYFNGQISIDKKKIDLTGLEYDETNQEDKEFYNELSNILYKIMKQFKEIFRKDINIKSSIFAPLINNCKCHCLYLLVLDSIIGLYFLNKNKILLGYTEIVNKL